MIELTLALFFILIVNIISISGKPIYTKKVLGKIATLLLSVPQYIKILYATMAFLILSISAVLVAASIESDATMLAFCITYVLVVMVVARIIFATEARFLGERHKTYVIKLNI